MKNEKTPIKGAGNYAAGAHISSANHRKSKSCTPVGGGFCVAFSIRPDGHIDCTWTPRMPTGREYRRRVSESEYQAALRRFLLDQVRGGE